MAARRQPLDHQMAVVGIFVVALHVHREPVDLDDHVVFLEGITGAGRLRDVDHHRAAGFAWDFQELDGRGVLSLLPDEVEIAETRKAARLLGFDDPPDERGRGDRADVAALRHGQSHHLAVGEHRLSPTQAADFGVQFEVNAGGETEGTIPHGELAEIGPPDLQVAVAPADDLIIIPFGNPV